MRVIGDVAMYERCRWCPEAGGVGSVPSNGEDARAWVMMQRVN